MRQMFSEKQVEKLVEEKFKELLESITGYDKTKTQVLKNDKGTFKWVNEA